MTPEYWPERFASKVDASGECWLWTGNQNGTGYGCYYWNGQQGYAHRYAYELEQGGIPDGLVIDHLCRTRNCVRPDHLEVVTMRENTLRGDTLPAENAAKTVCKNGHPLSGENLYVRPSGRRSCRACHREENRRYWQRRQHAPE